MMRCNNCGFNNSPNQLRCEKCNAPLKGSMLSQEEALFPLDTDDSKDALKKTIKGKDAETVPWDCPGCGRPFIQGARVCNNCGYVLSSDPAGGSSVTNEGNEMVYRTGKKASRSTIDPYQKGFILKPLPSKYDKEMQDVQVKANTEKVVLGREALEPGNMTISARHAEFVMRQGKWYIRNVSTKEATFVFAGEYMEIQEGDIILLGDRKFVFSS